MARVWVVGSLNVDRPWRVARHPHVGETVTGESLEPLPGGKGLNQAVAAARMGAEVVLLGCVGDDEDGRWLVSVAAAEGIDVSQVATVEGTPTGSALIVIAQDGANTVTVDAGANGSLTVDGLLGIEADDVVVAQLEVPVEAVRAAFAEARAVGARAVLNPSPMGVGRALVADADVVVVNEPEATELASGDHAVPADGQVFVVTLGAGGVRVVEGARANDSWVVPGVAVTTVDTTGAGDCFLGVLAAAMAGGVDLRRAVASANRAAAVSVTRLGTVPAMPTAAEVEAFG